MRCLPAMWYTTMLTAIRVCSILCVPFDGSKNGNPHGSLNGIPWGLLDGQDKGRLQFEHKFSFWCVPKSQKILKEPGSYGILEHHNELGFPGSRRCLSDKGDCKRYEIRYRNKLAFFHKSMYLHKSP